MTSIFKPSLLVLAMLSAQASIAAPAVKVCAQDDPNCKIFSGTFETFKDLENKDRDHSFGFVYDTLTGTVENYNVFVDLSKHTDGSAIDQLVGVMSHEKDEYVAASFASNHLTIQGDGKPHSIALTPGAAIAAVATNTAGSLIGNSLTISGADIREDDSVGYAVSRIGTALTHEIRGTDIEYRDNTLWIENSTIGEATNLPNDVGPEKRFTMFLIHAERTNQVKSAKVTGNLVHIENSTLNIHGFRVIDAPLRKSLCTQKTTAWTSSIRP